MVELLKKALAFLLMSFGVSAPARKLPQKPAPKP
jgi:hypothetical protein